MKAEASSVKGPMCFISKVAEKVVAMEGKDLGQQRVLFLLHCPLQDVLVTAGLQVSEQDSGSGFMSS